MRWTVGCIRGRDQGSSVQGGHPTWSATGARAQNPSRLTLQPVLRGVREWKRLAAGHPIPDFPISTVGFGRVISEGNGRLKYCAIEFLNQGGER